MVYNCTTDYIRNCSNTSVQIIIRLIPAGFFLYWLASLRLETLLRSSRRIIEHFQQPFHNHSLFSSILLSFPRRIAALFHEVNLFKITPSKSLECPSKTLPLYFITGPRHFKLHALWPSMAPVFFLETANPLSRHVQDNDDTGMSFERTFSLLNFHVDRPDILAPFAFMLARGCRGFCCYVKSKLLSLLLPCLPIDLTLSFLA